MIILYILSLVLLQVQQTVPTTVAEQNIFINFGGCNCRPGWVCPDGRSSITYHSHILTFQNIYILRGKRNRLCTKFPETWRSFVHFSAQNKYCISNMKNGTYSYEIVLGDCRFNTFSVLTVNGEVTLSHYQTNYTPRMFSGEVKVTNGTLCFWDPRSPLANKNSILEVVDGCGYPQPTRVSVIKIILIKEDRPKFTRPTVCPCVHGQCKTSVSSGKVTMKCVCEEGWLGEKCDKQCDCKHKCVHGECKTQLKDNKNVNVCCCKAGWYGDFCTDRCKDDKMCVHGTCVENEKTNAKSCKCEEGWTGDLCDTATAVIVREERVWVKVGCKKVCLTLRKEGGEWRYYRYDKQDDKLEPFQPPPGFKWQVHLDGETIIISGKTAKNSDPVRTHKVNVRVKGKLETILLKLEHGKWNWYVRGSKGGWQDFHPPPGFSLTVKIGNDIIRIKPEATYHKIKMYEGKEEKVIYMMRVGNKWVPFSHHNSALRSYHPPSDHSVLVTIGDEHVHIKHSKPCTNNPCQNSGKCTDEGISFSCSCQPEWSGTTCEEKRKEPACKADTCGEHGKCVELQSGLVQCHCHRGWSGFRCNIPSSCPPLSCSNGGIMVTLNGEEHCQCPEGFSGKCCQKQVSICSRDPCNRRGLCEQVGVNFACHCHAPYSGRFCEIERKAVACKVGDQIFSVGQVISQHCNRCVCLESGHLVCTKRVCRAEHFIAPTNVKQIVFEGHMCGVSPCVYGRCSSVHYQPRCRCHAGYSGPTCETVVTVTQLSPDYREVTPYRPVVVQHQREVVVEQHHHHHHHHPVTLEEHHHHHPVRVEEHHHVVREIYQRPTIIHQPPPTYHNVEVHNHHHEAQIIQQRTIHQHSACSRVGCGQGSCNVIRSRPHCICRRGWQGSSCQHRIERDTEVSSPCSRHRCHNGGSCIVRSNSASCLCPAQFSGAVCQTADQCARVQCVHGTCNNGWCTCDSGWTGPRCDQFDTCSNKRCEHGQCIVSRDQGAQCHCDRGYVGESCDIADPCTEYNCGHGRCSLQSGAPVCYCHKGWTGKHCQKQDVCSTYRCQRGKCVLSNGYPTCQCDEGYHGTFCQLESLCLRNSPCIHGRCIEELGKAKCICDVGWAGTSCSNKNHCLNCKNGICNFITGQCHCNTGWTGQDCNTKHPCASYPCKHGKCKLMGHTIQCQCEPGWTGDHCDSFNQCTNISCINGGCVAENGISSCRCNPGFTGSRCEIRDFCHGQTCSGNGKCRIFEERAWCDCKKGWTGANCSKFNSASSSTLEEEPSPELIYRNLDEKIL